MYVPRTFFSQKTTFIAISTFTRYLRSKKFILCSKITNSKYFIGKPTAPGAPEPLEVTHDSITIFWKAPEDDGKCEIIEYVLEYQDVKEER